jgi:hypothetical protein
VLAVRQASALPSASFRFIVTDDTLAVQLILPLTGRIEDLHLRVFAPLPGAQKERLTFMASLIVSISFEFVFVVSVSI